MVKAKFLVQAIGLIGFGYMFLRTIRMIHRIGLVRFSSALGTLVASVLASTWELFAGARSQRCASAQSEPIDLSGTGGRYNARTGSYDSGQDPFGMYPDGEDSL